MIKPQNGLVYLLWLRGCFNNMKGELAKVTSELSKEVYHDLAHPTMSAIGEALGTVFNVFNLILAPLRRIQIASDEKTEAFKKRLCEKYEEIPSEKHIEPPAKIIYRIADTIKYNLEEEVLELFENLIISSLTKGKKVHPIYIDLLDNMTALDAQVFNLFGFKTEWGTKFVHVTRFHISYYANHARIDGIKFCGRFSLDNSETKEPLESAVKEILTSDGKEFDIMDSSGLIDLSLETLENLRLIVKKNEKSYGDYFDMRRSEYERLVYKSHRIVQEWDKLLWGILGGTICPAGSECVSNELKWYELTDLGKALFGSCHAGFEFIDVDPTHNFLQGADPEDLDKLRRLHTL